MKRATEYIVAKQVDIIELLYQGDHVGTIVSVFPTSKFTQCVTTVALYARDGGHPLWDYDHTLSTAKAGGWGYCRRSASIFDALTKMPQGMIQLGGKNLGGAGVRAVCKELEALGYECLGSTC
jgi:hypothetical protein|tara:strand:- start:1880 stop:2248 length:369 start_codon:yes stop_codon:yes gene_type:complete